MENKVSLLSSLLFGADSC